MYYAKRIDLLTLQPVQICTYPFSPLFTEKDIEFGWQEISKEEYQDIALEFQKINLETILSLAEKEEEEIFL